MSDNEKSFKNDGSFFLHLQSLLCSSYISVFIYDVTNWITNNYNIHIVRYLKKQRQTENKIWSVNSI